MNLEDAEQLSRLLSSFRDQLQEELSQKFYLNEERISEARIRLKLINKHIAKLKKVTQ